MKKEDKEDLTLPEIFVKTMEYFLPEFFPWLAVLPDSRNKNKIKYELYQIIWTGINLFLFKQEARHNIHFGLKTEAFAVNTKVFLEEVFPEGKTADTVPHGDTVEYSFKKIPEICLDEIRVKCIRALIRKKCFVNLRLLGTYYLVAIDGTQHIHFRERHCEHCLRQKVGTDKDGNPKYVYSHKVLEAKLILPNGMSLSFATEFIENEDENVSKQDCELKAFYRLEKTIKERFPQMNICLLMDGLYAKKPVFDICETNKWKYLIVFKEGSMPAVYREYEALKKLSPENRLKVTRGKSTDQVTWVNKLEYDGHSLEVVESLKTTGDKVSNYVFLSNIKVNEKNADMLTEGGRLRWKIENEGFNTQKKQGYNLEHIFSKDNNSQKNWYLAMQIAHIINQLMEKGDLLRDKITKTFGSIKKLTQKFWATFTEKVMDLDRVRWLLRQRIQITFKAPCLFLDSS